MSNRLNTDMSYADLNDLLRVNSSGGVKLKERRECGDHHRGAPFG
jgi:hypothetical protein